MFLIIGLGVACLLFAFQNCGGGGEADPFDLTPLSPAQLKSMVQPCGSKTCLHFYIDERLAIPKGTGLAASHPTNRLCTAASNAGTLVPEETGIPNFTFHFSVVGAGGVANILCDLDELNGSILISAD